MRKGLSVAKGGVVCLLQHYCPFCFKGKPGVSSGIKVKKGSPLVDEVQAMHAAKGNGLCPIDFRHPGEFCSNPLLCKLVCLVCGKTMVDGEDPEFELFLDVFGGYSSDEEVDVATNHEVKLAVKTLGLVWTDQWSTPIHKACSKKAACKCVVAIGTTWCPKCQWPVEGKGNAQAPSPPSFRAKAKAVLVQEGSGEKKPLLPPPVPRAKDLKLVAAPVVAVVRTKMALPFTKADWLPPPSMTAQAVHLMSPEPPLTGSRNFRDAYGIKGKAGAAVVKPPVKTIKTVRLEQAAATCAYKINAWTATHPTNKMLGGGDITGPSDAASTKHAGGKPFNLADHYRLFDPAQHGWMKIKGVKGFMHYNGVFIPTEHDVICIHEDGTITPG